MRLARFPNVDILTPGISDTVPFGTNKSGRQIFILTSISVHLKPAPHPGQPSVCLLSLQTQICRCALISRLGPQARSSIVVEAKSANAGCDS